MAASPGSRPSRGNGETPIRRQYEQLRAQHPEAILLFQLGDFFESFEGDARTVARICGVTLTSRELGKGDRVALAGVPITRLDHYLARLLEAGEHVAIAEQVSPAGAGLVDRVITRVVTPGTVAEPGLLREKDNNYLAALVADGGAVGLAYVDVTTGEFAATELSGDDRDHRLRLELERLAPAEVVLPDGQAEGLPTVGHRTLAPAWRFEAAGAKARLCRQLGVLSLEGYGATAQSLAVRASGAILSYLEDNNRGFLPNVVDWRLYASAAGMVLDGYTRRNLELVRNTRTGRLEGSLLAVIDRTRTPMGGRLVRRWLGQPLLDLAMITARQDAIGWLLNRPGRRGQIRRLLGHVGDLERQTGRVVAALAGPRELRDLAEALRTVAALAALLAPPPGGTLDWPAEVDTGPIPEPSIADLPGEPDAAGPPPALLGAEVGHRADWLDAAPDLVELIARGVAPAGSGRLIRPGYHAELDALVDAAARARQQVADLEHGERQRTGIKSLKVGYNQIFGYYLEVTRPNLPLVPPEYHRKQTLVQAERFTTPELKEWETDILRTEDRIAVLEQEIFAALRATVAAAAPRMRRLARSLAHLDVLAGLADLAQERQYQRPVVDHGTDLTLIEARHPVVEAALPPGQFIPNDCQLAAAGCRTMVLTGPNMAGKSTYLRQVALIVLLAQLGSYVPAQAARIGLVDRLFTRVGAQDDLAAGASTFMVEMMETANILRHATVRSLLVLDEIGRGTSTFDGLSIARAVVEEVHQHIGARTLFATHFHELADLAVELPGVQVWNVAVAERGPEVIFLRQVVPGAADRSYGIQVARLAGLPARVVARAGAILRELEAVANPDRAAVAVPNQPVQLPLPGLGVPPVTAAELVAALLALDPDQLTPLEALQQILALQRRAGRR